MTAVGHLAFDEFGRPFFILKDEDKQKRMTGTQAIRVCVHSIYINIILINLLIT